MRFAQIRKFDVANGPGIRTTIFVSGCTHNCPGCFNKEYQNFRYGDVWTQKQTEEVISYLKEDSVSGLSLLGGEPFQSAKDLAEVVKEIKKETDKNIWVYSGYIFEDIIKDEDMLDLLSVCDVLVDGLFVEELKDLTLKFRGSSNQRIIDIKRSLEDKEPVAYKI